MMRRDRGYGMKINLKSIFNLNGIEIETQSNTLGELLSEGKANLQAPWLGISGFVIMASMLILLVFAGEAVRDALDPRAAA